MKFVDTFNYHLQNPEETFEIYSKKQKIKLGKNILNTKKIYLDTKYWVFLRDADLNRAKDESKYQFLALLNQLSESNKVICPISEDIFIEVLKQSDRHTLETTVNLIDKFSKGISLISFEERLRLELFHFLSTTQNIPVYKIQELVWTKLVYTLGFIYPCWDSLKSDSNNLLQKDFFDQLWSVTLIDIVRKSNNSFPLIYNNLFEKLNEGKFQHQHENNTFEQMFLSELGGLLDVYENDFQELFIYWYEKSTGDRVNRSEISQSNCGQLIANSIYNFFKSKKNNTDLASYRIYSGLHAAIRWDKNQRYHENDLHDINHAVAAIPYCEYFFTEKRLCHMITQNLLQYDRLFNCHVVWRLKDTISCLEDL